MCQTVQSLPHGESCSSLSHISFTWDLDLQGPSLGRGLVAGAESHQEARGARLSHSGHLSLTRGSRGDSPFPSSQS